VWLRDAQEGGPGDLHAQATAYHQCHAQVSHSLAAYRQDSLTFKTVAELAEGMLLLAEQRFRRLVSPERLKEVFLEVQFRDGIGVKAEDQVAAA
jgi:hypothetical protein